MTRTFDEFRAVYSDGFGTEFEAIYLPWDFVIDILGSDHEGSGEEYERLIQTLREMGAPEWIDEAEGWIDEYGWGLIGPRLSVDVTNPWSGVSVTLTRKDVTAERLEALAALMPGDIREELHRESMNDPWIFWVSYVDYVGPEEAGKLWFS